MIKGTILKLDLNTGVGTCKLDSSNKEVEFNALKLQDGDSTNLYHLSVGKDIYFMENTVNDSKIDAPYYLFDFEDQFAIVKSKYETSDREPLVGDFVLINNKKRSRIARISDDMIQSGEGAPFVYLDDGLASYSGGLDSPVSKNSLSDLDQMELATFWTFKDGARANNGINLQMLVKVWKLTTNSDED